MAPFFVGRTHQGTDASYPPEGDRGNLATARNDPP
jgi:hypothetical protein